MSYFGIIFSDKIFNKAFQTKRSYIVILFSLVQGIHVPSLRKKVQELFLASLFWYPEDKLTGLAQDKQ